MKKKRERVRKCNSYLPGIFLHWQRVEKYTSSYEQVYGNSWCHKTNFPARRVLKIRTLLCLSRLSWLENSSKSWECCARSDIDWRARNLETKCSAQSLNCCGWLLAEFKVPFSLQRWHIIKSSHFEEIFPGLAQRRLPEGKDFPDLVHCIKLIWLSRSDQKWVSAKQRKENFLMDLNSIFIGFHAFLEIKFTYKRTPFP